MDRMEKKYQRSQIDQVRLFNAAYTVGTLCRYWKGVREGEGKLARTRTEAQMLSGHTAVVWLEGVSGCISLSHVEAEAAR
jgi:hypothetical protein